MRRSRLRPFEHEVHAAVGLALVLAFGEHQPADLLQAGHVAAAVGLHVEPHDVHQAQLGQVMPERGLQLEQLLLGSGRIGGHEGDPHGQILGDQGIGAPEPLLERLAVELLEGEIDPGLVGGQLVAGHAHLIVLEHHAVSTCVAVW